MKKIVYVDYMPEGLMVYLEEEQELLIGTGKDYIRKDEPA